MLCEHRDRGAATTWSRVCAGLKLSIEIRNLGSTCAGVQSDHTSLIDFAFDRPIHVAGVVGVLNESGAPGLENDKCVCSGSTSVLVIIFSLPHLLNLSTLVCVQTLVLSLPTFSHNLQ